MTVTLKVGESPLLKAVECSKAAQTFRAQGNCLMADTYESYAKELLRCAATGER